MRRHALGLMAIVLLAVGIFARGGTDDTISGTCLRVGSVLGIFWLAWPQLERIPAWAIGAIGLGLLIVMRWPKMILAALPAAFVLWLLRPRGPRAGASDPRENR
jgi:hypothetical protein